MKLSTILHSWHYLTKTSRNCQWGSHRCTLHANLQLTYEAFPSNPSKFTHVQSMHLAPHSLGAHAILPARATHSLAGEQPTDGPPGGQAVRSTAPHPKSRHVWLTLTGLLESNQPFAERHSLNDNANQLLHYLACASARERKESNLLIKCQDFLPAFFPPAQNIIISNSQGSWNKLMPIQDTIHVKVGIFQLQGYIQNNSTPVIIINYNFEVLLHLFQFKKDSLYSTWKIYGRI